MTYADKENFMKKYITDENTGINYTLVGDVYIPILYQPILIMKSAIGAENIRNILNNINRRFIQPCLLNVN